MKPRYRLTAFLLSVIFALTSVQFCSFAEEASTETEQPVEVTSTTAATTEKAEKTTKKKEKTTKKKETTKAHKDKTKKEAKQTLASQREALQKRLADSEAKLSKFSTDAKSTQAYIDTLDEKIGYLNEELNILDAEVAQSQKKIDELTAQITPLEKETKSLKKQYSKAKKNYDKLRKSFDSTYDAYCLRLRALYISGNSSVISALLTSDGLSQFLSRLEMIRAVARSDTVLLKTVNREMDKIVTEQNGLNEKQKDISAKQSVLDKKRKQLQTEQDSVTSKQAEIADKKVKIAEDRAESDRLFAEYAQKAQIYTEFRNEDEELIKQVDSEIDALLKGLKDPGEVTTVNAKQDSKKVTGSFNAGGELFSNNNAALSLCYPAPGHTGVSQVFGHYRNGKAHTGIDYPCPMRSKIVAAQKGIVITVRRLNYSYGYYVMVYHGTDAKGRKVVTLYAHNSNILVSVGQSVRKGQQIAESGSTGNSTGPHCHFEVILDGAKVNPKNYVG